MRSSKEILELLDQGLNISFDNTLDFDPDYFVKLLGDRIVLSGDKPYTIAEHKEDPTDCSERTEYFDWHSDGMYHYKPPKYVLLHCLDPGKEKITTDLSTTKFFLHRDILKKLRSHYVGHGGNFDHPIISDDGILLASRGYVSSLPNLPLEEQPTVRDISENLYWLFNYLDSYAIRYKWKAGDTLIFNQYQYLHRRNSNAIDKDRKLIRMWFT